MPKLLIVACSTLPDCPQHLPELPLFWEGARGDAQATTAATKRGKGARQAHHCGPGHAWAAQEATVGWCWLRSAYGTPPSPSGRPHLSGPGKTPGEQRIAACPARSIQGYQALQNMSRACWCQALEGQPVKRLKAPKSDCCCWGMGMNVQDKSEKPQADQARGPKRYQALVINGF